MRVALNSVLMSVMERFGMRLIALWGLFFRKYVCEAVSALILLSLLDAGACLLGDFVE